MAYAWHPACQTEVDVLYEELRRGEKVYVCLLPKESSVVVPSWMFDQAACASMKVGTPRVSVAALEEVRVILAELGFDVSAAAANTRLKENANATAEDIKGTRGLEAVAAGADRTPVREPGGEKPQIHRRNPGAPAPGGGRGGRGKGAAR